MFNSSRKDWRKAGRKAFKRASHGRQEIHRSITALVKADKEVNLFEQAAADGQVVTVINEGEGGASDVPYWLQADPSLNNPDMMRKRFALRNSTMVLAALGRWWSTIMHSASPFDAPKIGAFGERGLARGGYDLVFLKVFRCMLEEFDESEAKRTLDEDWLADSEGCEVLSCEKVFDALFQLADVWTDGVNPKEYAEWLDELLCNVSHPIECGCPGRCNIRVDCDDHDDDGDEDRSTRRKLNGDSDISYQVEYNADSEAPLIPEPVPEPSSTNSSPTPKRKKKEEKSPRRSSKKAEQKKEEFSALAIQKKVRAKTSVKKAEKRKEAASSIGAAVKGNASRKATKKRKESVVAVQACARGAIERKRYWHMIKAAMVLQAGFRKIRNKAPPCPPRPVEMEKAPAQVQSTEMGLDAISATVSPMKQKKVGVSFPGAQTSLSLRSRPVPVIQTPLTARLALPGGKRLGGKPFGARARPQMIISDTVCLSARARPTMTPSENVATSLSARERPIRIRLASDDARDMPIPLRPAILLGVTDISFPGEAEVKLPPIIVSPDMSRALKDVATGLRPPGWGTKSVPSVLALAPLGSSVMQPLEPPILLTRRRLLPYEDGYYDRRERVDVRDERHARRTYAQGHAQDLRSPGRRQGHDVLHSPGRRSRSSV